MTIKPCNNCKKTKACWLLHVLKAEGHRQGPWALERIIRCGPTRAALIRAEVDADELELECQEYIPVKTWYPGKIED